ncbi:MAG TPA: vWA domain-containing protein, partial [Longimicrobium sp.]|nr:vWA domain-containing protein [Longimicrobium sp.]
HVGPTAATWGVERAPVEDARADVILVVDASNSMLVEDVAPNRLEIEREAVRALLGSLRGARVGLVVFAGQGYVVSPLTSDFGALELYVDALGPDVITQGGSSLSDAVRQGLTLLLGGGREDAGGSLVVITDGDALEERDEVLRAAVQARRAGVPVHALGIGAPQGGRVPDVDFASGRRLGWKTEPDGTPAVSRLGEPLLRDLANRTGGTYRRVASARDAAGLQGGFALSGGGGGAGRGGGGTGPGNRYEWFVAAALLLLVLDSVVAARQGRRAMEGGR